MRNLRRRPWFLTLLALALLPPASLAAQENAGPPGDEPPTSTAPDPGGPVIYQVEFRQAVQPISGDFLIQSLKQADEADADLFLVLVDTPGGLVSTTEEILDAFLSAETPVVYYISPRGAMAASAGFIMALAADFIAAAPGTSLGAAAVITMQGEGAEEGGEQSTALKKMAEMLGARVRSMAERRGRDPELAASAIFDAKAWSAKEAEELGLVDLIVDSRGDLLQALDGRTLRRFDGSEVVLDLAGYRVVEMEMSWRQKALNVLANPTLSYFLLLIGIGGILMEFYNPGLIVPGVVGVVALVLFGFTVKILPISVIGVILVLMAIAFFIAEVKVTSYGLLTLGGILCLVLGGLMLVGDEAPDIPEFTVDPLLLIGFAVSFGIVTAWAMTLVVRAHSQKVTTGSEGLVGEIATVATTLDPEGKVYLRGEYWDAMRDTEFPIGAHVKVLDVRGLQLHVGPTEGPDTVPADEGSEG